MTFQANNGNRIVIVLQPRRYSIESSTRRMVFWKWTLAPAVNLHPHPSVATHNAANKLISAPSHLPWASSSVKRLCAPSARLAHWLGLGDNYYSPSRSAWIFKPIKNFLLASANSSTAPQSILYTPRLRLPRIHLNQIVFIHSQLRSPITRKSLTHFRRHPLFTRSLLACVGNSIPRLGRFARLEVWMWMSLYMQYDYVISLFVGQKESLGFLQRISHFVLDVYFFFFSRSLQHHSARSLRYYLATTNGMAIVRTRNEDFLEARLAKSRTFRCALGV